jgi:RimJ/RimL family protein N-acetyltransferase
MQITLRNVNQDDLPIFYEQQLDMEATQMAAFPSREKEAFMTHWKTKVLANETGMVKTILFDQQVAGNIVSYEMGDQREIGYWLGKEFWGKSIASESLKQFLGQEVRRPLFAHVAKHNIGSRRVLEKCGFVIIGEDKVPFEDREVEEFILKLDE